MTSSQSAPPGPRLCADSRGMTGFGGPSGDPFVASGPLPRAGRYAPSPSGDLHLGNLRTAVLAWLIARSTGREFRLRVDDIDAQRSSAEAAERQLRDLAAVGVTPDGPVVTQQGSVGLYARALEQLADAGLVYECYCSRRDIQDAARAPHSAPGVYPGTCRDLSTAQREARARELSQLGRVPALRLRAGVRRWDVRERLAGAEGETFTGVVDDVVLRRGGNVLPGCGAGEPGDDGAGGHGADFAYNLAVVVDDAAAGVDQVVRGADLLDSAPRQAYLGHLLGLPPVEYWHVPLVLGPTGKRLAKRDGAVTLRELGVEQARAWIAGSLGDAVGEAAEARGTRGAAGATGVGVIREGAGAGVDFGEVAAETAAGAEWVAGLLGAFDVRTLSRDPVVYQG